MNRIYKVKKNAAGNSVACSEFAKGHAKKAVLGSLLVIGALGMATTASAQQTGNTTNKTTGRDSTIGGGIQNEAKGDYSTIGGGKDNRATTYNSTIGGGSHNQAEGGYSTVGGGYDNRATGLGSTIGGGESNQATGRRSTVGGGYLNYAIGEYSTVGGGDKNKAIGEYSTVGGGNQNQATGKGSFAAGVENQANTENAVAVGKKNIIDGNNSVAIGSNNTVENDKKDVFILGSNTSGVQSNSVLLGNNTSGKEATTVNNATVGNLNLTGFAGTSKAENGVVSVGSEGGERQIVNVGAGKISATSTDAVNGSQLHALATAINEKLSGNINTKTNNTNTKTAESLEKAVSQNQDDIAKNQADADAKFKGVQTDIANNKTTLAQHANQINENKQAIEAKLGGKVDVQKLAELKTNVDKNKADADAKFTATEVAIAKNTQSITTLDSKVNTFDGRISALDAKVNGFDGRINALDDKFKNGMAAQAALNGLFQPYSVGKVSISAAIGGYGSKSAIAIGAGYRVNPQLAFKGGTAINVSGSKKKLL